jgi:O-antigen ligase
MALRPAPAMPRAAIHTPVTAVPAVAFRERLLLTILYLTVLSSSMAFIEPSPHDAMMVVLAVACLIAGVRFERPIAPLLVLLLLWNVAGLISVIDVVGEEKTIQYAVTSLYLAMAALVFACVLAQNTETRLAALRSAYIATALFASLLGLGVYVHLLPGEDLFMWVGRVKSTFKDPNVFGPFLILPTLFLIERLITRKITLGAVTGTMILLAALLFSFSRGAWINFALSAAVMLVLLILTGPTPNARLRPIVLGAAAIGSVVLALAALSTIESVRNMLLTRAHLTQSYDVGDGGRFFLQEIAFSQLFEHPLGLGPFEFARIYGLQQHNVYLQAFLVYGWLGGVSYIALVLLTLFVGLRQTFVRSPWQFSLAATCAAFVGNTFESFIIDSDHWRLFFLLLGVIWGLSAATIVRTRHASSGEIALNAPPDSAIALR